MAGSQETGISNYHEVKAADGKVIERSWQMPNGTRIAELATKFRNSKDVTGQGTDNKTIDIFRGNITAVLRIEEREPGSGDKFVQWAEYFEKRPDGTYDSREEYERMLPSSWTYSNSIMGSWIHPKSILVLEGYTLEGSKLRIQDKRRYLRVLYSKPEEGADGEAASFYDDEGRPIIKHTIYKKIPQGWKKTTDIEEIDPLDPIRRTYQLTSQEEVLDSRPSMPHHNQLNFFSSINIPEAKGYFKLPPF